MRTLVIGLIEDDVLAFHRRMEQMFKSEPGIRDLGLLESAIHAPFQTFAGEDLFPSLFDKAARLCIGIACNHAFVDGNKRAAVHAMELFLCLNNIELHVEPLEMGTMILRVANDEIDVSRLSEWLRQRA